MFDIGWSELMVIGVVALVVIGPKDLPNAIYTLGKWVRKARLVARDFQGHLDDMMREAELNDLRQQALKARDMHLGNVIDKAVDPDGRLKHVFDLEVKDTSHLSPDAQPAASAAPPAAAAPDVPGIGTGVGSAMAAFDVSAAGAAGHAGSPPEDTVPEPPAASAPAAPAVPAADTASKPAPDKTA